MPGTGTSSGDDRQTAHELWLATQTAHDHYQSASAALDKLRTIGSGDVVTSNRKQDVDLMVGIERTAFEDYIEARLQLSEFLASRSQGAPVDAAPEAGSRSRNPRNVLLAVIAALLSLMGFELRDLSSMHRERQNLERSRDAANAALTQKQQQVQALADQLEALKASKLANAAAAQVRISAARSGRTAVRRFSPNRGNIARNQQAPLHKQAKGHYREFNFTPRARREHVDTIGGKSKEPNS